MSLSPAKKQSTEKPTSGSVMQPVDKAEKDADIDRKLRLYGVIQAFRHGKLADNHQIDTTLKYVLDHSPVDVDKLSPDGGKLVQDIKDIIETARLIVEQKNADELFQNFVWHTRRVDADKIKKDSKDITPETKDVSEPKEEAVHHLRTLLNLVMTNSEVRKLLSDFGFIGRDLLAKVMEETATMIRPSKHQLADVDSAGSQDKFVTENNKQVDQEETPRLQARVPGISSQDPHMSELQTSSNGQGASASNTVHEQKHKLDEAKETAQEQPSDIKRQASDNKVDVETKKLGFKEKIKGIATRNGFAERSQEIKDRVSDPLDRANAFLAEEYFPEERRDQFIYRFKKVIIECQKHEDYQESIRWLLDTLKNYHGYGKEIANNAGEQGQAIQDPALNLAATELKTLLERFANGTSMDNIKKAIDMLYHDANGDQELRDWFKSVESYSRNVLLEPGFVLEPECNDQGRKLRESGRRFYDDKYKDHFDNLFNTIGDWFKQMGEDPLNTRFGEDWARLTKDLLFDSEGSLKFKSDLWADVRKVILPTLVDQVGYVPIPRIEYTDDSLDLVIENLTLSGRNLFPNVVTLEAKNYFKFSPYDVIKDSSSHDIILHFGQMQADMRDVAFYFRRKTGIPKLSDSGLADVLVGGEGVNVTVEITSSTKDKSSVFKVKSVHVKVDSLKFSIRDSKHDILYRTLKPLATGLVKRQIQKVIQDGVRTGLEYLDGQLVAVRDRMEAAKAEQGKDGIEIKTRMQVLQEMFQKKKEETASSTASKRDSHFKVVSKRESAILPDTGHPAGWVNRASERLEAASAGSDWRSDAFNIVS